MKQLVVLGYQIERRGEKTPNKRILVDFLIRKETMVYLMLTLLRSKKKKVILLGVKKKIAFSIQFYKNIKES